MIRPVEVDLAEDFEALHSVGEHLVGPGNVNVSHPHAVAVDVRALAGRDRFRAILPLVPDNRVLVGLDVGRVAVVHGPRVFNREPVVVALELDPAAPLGRHVHEVVIKTH